MKCTRTDVVQKYVIIGDNNKEGYRYMVYDGNAYKEAIEDDNIHKSDVYTSFIECIEDAEEYIKNANK